MATGGDPPGSAETARALAAPWRAVAARDRTEAELRALLERRGIRPSAVEAAVDELHAAGHLDDAAYARRFAEDRRALDRWGADRIARDLARRGIAASVVSAAVAEPDGGARERRAAHALLAERFPEPPRDDRGRDRAWRLLVRRGYARELAYEAVRAYERDGGGRASPAPARGLGP